MKFLFIPEYEREFDFRMMHALGRALTEADHSYELMPTDGYDIRNATCYDVVFGVNRARPEDLPAEVVYIAWIQDYRPWDAPDYAGYAKGNDIIYTLGSNTWIGFNNPGPNFCGSLLTGVHPELLDIKAGPRDLDFSICGYIPIPFTKVDMNPMERRCLKEVDRLYRPLTGSSNAFMMAGQMQRFVDQLIVTEKIPESEHKKVGECACQLCIEYPRYIDRLRLAQLAYFASAKCGFYGVNWMKYYQFGKCIFPQIRDEARLHQVYQRSKITLHNNWNGFGLHSRVLEAMATGCFVMGHSCADPQAAGRLTCSFEPDVHFGQYTPDNFGERTRYWLENETARDKATNESRKIIASKHMWKHTVQQVMKDLH